MGFNMKKLVSAVISVILLLSLAAPCFASYYREGWFESHTTHARYSCDGDGPADYATNIRLAAEGCKGSESLGAKTGSYDYCDSGHSKEVKYFHLFSKYGYVIVGGKGNGEGYKALKKYVY